MKRRSFLKQSALAVTGLAALAESPFLTGATAQSADRPGPTAIPWEPVGLSGGGAMFTPAISPVDPNLMLLNCDMGAAYLSEDGGHHWRMIHHAQLHSDIRCRPAFHPTDRNIIYASSWGALKISRDAGRTFADHGDLHVNLFGEIAVHPSDPRLMLAGVRDGGCRVSRDAGLTWSPCPGPVGPLIAFHFDQTRPGRTLLAATEQGIWRSDDAGKSWTAKITGLPWTSMQGFAGGSNATGAIVMLYCSIRSQVENGRLRGGIYRSRDRGDTWESVPGAGLNVETAKADEWGYADIAQYQQLLTTDAQPLTVCACNSGTGFYPPHSDTVYRSDDGGEHWHPTYFQDPRFKECNVAPDWVTASCGKTFKGGDAPFGVAVCNTDPQRILLLRNEAHITHDGGATWFTGHTAPAPHSPPAPHSAWLCNGLVVTTTWHFYVDPFEPRRQYICYTDIGFARSLDAGQTWIWWDPKSWPPWRNTCYELGFDPAIPGKIWGAFSDVHDIPNDNIISERHGHTLPGGICLSTDFGASWKEMTQDFPSKPVTSVVVDPRSPPKARTLYAGVFGEGVFKSTDDGQTWSLKKAGLGHPNNMRVYRVILNPDGTLFAVICGRRSGEGQPLLPEGVGLYRSTDGAETWEKINGSAPLLYLKDFSVDPRDSRRILLGAADAGRGDESGGLYFTTDGGQNWRRIGRAGPQTFGGYFHPSQAGWIYMTLTEGAPGAGLWLSQDEGKSWTPFAGVPFANIQRVEFANDDVIHLTTFGGGVWRGPAAPVV